jgi:hypothetical protein
MTIRVVLGCALQHAGLEPTRCPLGADASVTPSNTRDVMSDAVIARVSNRAIDQVVLEAAAACSVSDALQRSASDATAERVRDGTDEIFNIRVSAARVNMKRCRRASSAIT